MLKVVLPAPDGGEEGSVLVRHVLVASSLGYEGLAGPPVITRHSSRSDRHPHWDPLTPAETDRLRVSSELSSGLTPHSSPPPALMNDLENISGDETPLAR